MTKTPIFIEFAELLRKNIESGIYKPAEKLPTEEELEKKYRINRKTIRKAKKILCEEGLIVSVKGKGSFVKKPKLLLGLDGTEGFTATSLKLGLSPNSFVISREKKIAGTKLATIFKINNDDYVFKLIRIRRSDSTPILVEITYVPCQLIDDIEKYDFSVSSLNEVMYSKKILINKVVSSIEIVSAFEDLCKVFNIKEGSPVYKIENLSFSSNDMCVEYTNSYTNDDKVAFVDRYEKDF